MSYPLSTAEAVLRRWMAIYNNTIDSAFLLSTAEAVLRHVITADHGKFSLFLLSTVEAVLRHQSNCLKI